MEYKFINIIAKEPIILKLLQNHLNNLKPLVILNEVKFRLLIHYSFLELFCSSEVIKSVFYYY